MKEEKDYKIVYEDIVFRRAISADNMEKMAELVYNTDPYIYPFWFNNDIEEAKRVLGEKMTEEGFLYYYKNCYVAVDLNTSQIVGLVCAIDPSTNLDYDYSELESVNHNYKFTIENYVKEIIKEVQEKKYMYLVNVAVDVNYRGNKVGTRMLSSFIKQMHEEAYDEIGFDCLMHNLRAKNLYHSLGFKEVAEGIGFDGTDYSTVEVVFFKRKITSFTPRDFQMMPGTDVKKNDLEREKYIFDCLTKKENINLDII